MGSINVLMVSFNKSIGRTLPELFDLVVFSLMGNIPAYETHDCADLKYYSLFYQ